MKKITLTLILIMLAAQSYANDCVIDMTSNDLLQYNLKEFTVSKKCAEITLNLSHTGKLPKMSMGHNVVITKTQDSNAVSVDGLSAGLDNQYVKPGDKRVIAFTNMIGGGEKTAVTFKTQGLDAGGDYTFFCSFPGHIALMNGKMKVVE